MNVHTLVEADMSASYQLDERPRLIGGGRVH